ncbi:MAG TPA: hypothetical protein VK528_10520, partial [Flavobacterium sp.]|nr:hypothetical protein [Flavobacterium sp.]
MKHKLLLIVLFSMNLLFAGNSDKPVLGPAIGLIMNGYFLDQNTLQFTFTIKNTGDQTLTNIYITNTLFDSSNLEIYYTQVPGTAIPSLAPGEENLYSFSAYKPGGGINNCIDMSQALVHATKPDGNEITDLSDPYDYYLDGASYTPFQYNIDFNIWHTYQDNNNNSVADVGDSIIYMYQVNYANGSFQFGISDNNAVLDTPMGDTNFAWVANGYHNITQADVDLGYVFNGVEIMPYVSCSYWISWNDNTLCTNCPVPTLPGNIIFTTKLTDLLPNTISGQVKFNSNNDNCATGTAFPNRMVVTSDNTNSFATFTNSAGNYSILIPNVGNYDTGATSSLNNNFSSNPVSVPVTSSGENVNYANTNFCISSATGYSNLSISMIPTDHARPGFDSHYRLYFSNYGSTALSGTLQMVFDETKASFVSATPAQAAFAVNTLTWNYTNLIPFEWRYIDITLNVFAPPTVNDGDVIHFSAVGNPIAGDAFPADNMLMFDQNVVNAFDPNEKIVLEGAMIQPSQAANYLHYMTHFQNTGSASATTVVLKE